jgi:hypothetical protein
MQKSRSTFVPLVMSADLIKITSAGQTTSFGARIGSARADDRIPQRGVPTAGSTTRSCCEKKPLPMLGDLYLQLERVR